jgi:hypothetical protein
VPADLVSGFLRSIARGENTGAVTVRVAITDTDDRVREQSTQVIEADQFVGGQADVRRRVPVADPSGREYLLSVRGDAGIEERFAAIYDSPCVRPSARRPGAGNRGFMTRVMVLCAVLGLATMIATPSAQQTGSAPPTQTPPPVSARAVEAEAAAATRRAGDVADDDRVARRRDDSGRFSQAGAEVSPALSWTAPPETAKSFVLIVHDVDATNRRLAPSTRCTGWSGTFPRRQRACLSTLPQGGELPDGSRQISATGPVLSRPRRAGHRPRASLRLRSLRARRDDSMSPRSAHLPPKPAPP